MTFFANWFFLSLLHPELVFNFSQLSVNEISGEVMDIEVLEEDMDDGQQTDFLSISTLGTNDEQQLTPAVIQSAVVDHGTANVGQQSTSSTSSSTSTSTSSPPLPDIVSSHRSASFRLRAATAAASKHVHRNTMPSFSEVSASMLNGHHHQTEPRRTMSVSLPIEEQVILDVASQLRQISNDFSSSRQVRVLFLLHF